jgi:predicted FMN-binding regulatory protein PaiB
VYTPGHFAVTDKQQRFDFMEANSIAVLFTQAKGEPVTS